MRGVLAVGNQTSSSWIDKEFPQKAVMVEGGEHGQVQAEWTTATKRIVKHSSQKIRMLFHQDIVVHHVNYLGLVNPCCPQQQVQLSQARQVSASLIQKVNISLDHVEM